MDTDKPGRKREKMPTYIMTKREVGRAIALSEWLDYMAQSENLRPYPAHKGINPFTKKPIEFRPAPGSSFFETPHGDCSIEFQNGQLVLRAKDNDALPMIRQIADAIGATFRIDDAGNYDQG
jgi:hypothetical protein